MIYNARAWGLWILAHNLAIAGALCAAWEEARTCYGGDPEWEPGCGRAIER